MPERPHGQPNHSGSATSQAVSAGRASAYPCRATTNAAVCAGSAGSAGTPWCSANACDIGTAAHTTPAPPPPRPAATRRPCRSTGRDPPALLQVRSAASAPVAHSPANYAQRLTRAGAGCRGDQSPRTPCGRRRGRDAGSPGCPVQRPRPPRRCWAAPLITTARVSMSMPVRRHDQRSGQPVEPLEASGLARREREAQRGAADCRALGARRRPESR